MDKVISIYNHQYKDQRGVVALLASIIIGILLVLITVSGIVLMSTEVRQATDFDQSVKAYYAAETGVEDALAEIKRRIDGGETLADILSGGTEACSNFLGSGPNPNNISGDPNATVSYTCQVVELAGNEINGVLDVEEAVQIDLSGANFNKLEIHWNQQGLDAPNLFGVPLFLLPVLLMQVLLGVRFLY
jgi:Tfp pilus assembly protein PilX